MYTQKMLKSFHSGDEKKKTHSFIFKLLFGINDFLFSLSVFVFRSNYHMNLISISMIYKTYMGNFGMSACVRESVLKNALVFFFAMDSMGTNYMYVG